MDTILLLSTRSCAEQHENMPRGRASNVKIARNGGRDGHRMRQSSDPSKKLNSFWESLDEAEFAAQAKSATPIKEKRTSLGMKQTSLKNFSGRNDVKLVTGKRHRTRQYSSESHRRRQESMETASTSPMDGFWAPVEKVEPPVAEVTVPVEETELSAGNKSTKQKKAGMFASIKQSLSFRKSK